jgi:hypothetical protein
MHVQDAYISNLKNVSQLTLSADAQVKKRPGQLQLHRYYIMLIQIQVICGMISFTMENGLSYKAAHD